MEQGTVANIAGINTGLKYEDIREECAKINHEFVKEAIAMESDLIRKCMASALGREPEEEDYHRFMICHDTTKNNAIHIIFDSRPYGRIVNTIIYGPESVKIKSELILN